MEPRDGDRARNRPPVLARRPADRDYFDRIKQNTKASRLNTVIDPRVDVAADVAAINRGEAQRREDTYTVAGRAYVLEPNGTLSPRHGDGFFVLNRAVYRAVGIYRMFGFGERAEGILDQMHNVGVEERAAARVVVAACTDGD